MESRLKFLIFFSIVTLLIGCKQNGTDSGNPSNQKDPSGQTGCSDSRQSTSCLQKIDFKSLTDIVCNTYKKCYSQFSETACTDSLYKNSQFFDYYEITGVPNSGYEFERLIIDKKIKIETNNFTNCVKNMDQLSCSDPALLDGYNEAEENNYLFVLKIFDQNDQCKNMFIF
jgi:hypothetical protein